MYIYHSKKITKKVMFINKQKLIKKFNNHFWLHFVAKNNSHKKIPIMAYRYLLQDKNVAYFLRLRCVRFWNLIINIPKSH